MLYGCLDGDLACRVTQMPVLPHGSDRKIFANLCVFRDSAVKLPY